MKRNSKLALVTAIFFLIAGSASWWLFGDHSSGPFDQAFAEQYIKAGVKLFEERDTTSLIDMIAPDASFFNRSRDQIRSVVRQTTDDLGKTKLQLTMSKLVVEPGVTEAKADFDVQIREKTEKIDVLYYTLHVHIRVARVKVRYLLGMGSSDVWKITEAGGDFDLQLPVIDHD